MNYIDRSIFSKVGRCAAQPAFIVMSMPGFELNDRNAINLYPIFKFQKLFSSPQY
jgi:hypothetical protein